MSFLRTFLRSRRWLAMLIVAAALCVRALVPAGFMIADQADSHTITIQICSGSSVKPMTLALPASHSDGKHGGKAVEAPCAFTALSMGAVAHADPLQLALALVFILLLGFLPLPATLLCSRVHILPPQCGPPAFA
ncbi:hypothetical protein [Novosphingobium sp. KACC 22771]|uniref:hypothetical protein n=1 Tax=Novosphingobium sp. KACC 22771 TaxID=3025670 RepID=UPI0023658D74|nr:hypothetical protein [Novosphingobium sp. KACC 22771]WDF70940.1 hypothetical protein PQ467_08755 [Novosphingobium sp. KACC 22771]